MSGGRRSLIKLSKETSGHKLTSFKGTHVMGRKFSFLWGSVFSHRHCEELSCKDHLVVKYKTTHASEVSLNN